MGLQRERVPAGVAALAAVLLALPSVVAPTWQLTTLDSQSGVVLFDQQFWSWGRSRVQDAGGAVVQDLWNVSGLVAFLLLVALAAFGALAWMLVRAPWVPVVALLSWAGLVGHLATTTADRLGRPVRDDVHGLAAGGASTTVGALESVAALAAVVAVALLVLSLTGLRMPSGWIARVRALVAPDEEDDAAGKHRGDPGEVPARPPMEGPVPAAATAEGVPGDVAVPGEAAAPAPSSRRMRVAAAVVGAVGVLLAASTTVWPTTVLAVRVPEVGDFTKGYEQRVWSWGRQVIYSSDGVLLDAYTGPNPVPRLVLLVAVLLLAVVGIIAWVVVPGRRGELPAAVGIAAALAVVAASVVERLSFDEQSIGVEPGQVRITTVAGWLETVSLVVLGAALAVVVLPVAAPRFAAAVAAATRAAVTTLRERVPSSRNAPEGVSAARSEPRGPTGAGPSRSGPDVGFSDVVDAPDARGRLGRRRPDDRD